MKSILFFCFISQICFAQIQIGNDINGTVADEELGFSTSISADGNRVAIGSPYSEGNGNFAGHVKVFQNINETWTQIGSDINGETEDDQSGKSIALSSDGTTLAIGAPENDGNGDWSGQVRVYKYILSEWIQVGSDIDGEANENLSGCSVSLSAEGNIIAIGARFNSGANGFFSGHTRVYQNIEGIWIQIGQDIDGESADDESGRSVSISANGSIIAIGAPLNSTNNDNFQYSGHTRIYENISGTWMQVGEDIDGEAADDQSGSCVSLSDDGNIVAIGSIYNSGNGYQSGHVRIYENLLGIWTQIGADINGEYPEDFSGWKVSISADGSIVAIGGFANDGNGSGSGHVRIYQNISGGWLQRGVDIDGEEEEDYSGSSLALSANGGMVAIGAVGNDANGNNSGQVRVYNLSLILSSESYVLNNFNIYPNPVSKILTIDLV